MGVLVLPWPPGGAPVGGTPPTAAIETPEDILQKIPVADQFHLDFPGLLPGLAEFVDYVYASAGVAEAVADIDKVFPVQQTFAIIKPDAVKAGCRS